jgi:ribosomal protein S27AE
VNHLSQNRKAIEAFSDLFAPAEVQVAEEKKTCPNCGKTILADSLYCPFCEHDQSQPAPIPPERQPGYHFAVLEVFASLLLLDLSLPVLFLLLLQPFSGHEIVAAAAGVLWLAFKVLLAWRVIEVRSGPDGLSFWKALGLFFLSIFPVSSWVAMGIASPKMALGKPARYALPVLAVALLFLNLGFITNRIPTSDGRVLFSALSSSPLSPIVVHHPDGHSASVALTSTPAPNCRRPKEITLQDVGSTLCVRGVVRWAFAQSLTYYVSFSTGATDFYMVGYNWPEYPGSGVNPGDCLQITGLVQQLGNNPVMVVDPADLQQRCPG